MLTWILKHDSIIKKGWCHNLNLEQAIQAVLYQSGIDPNNLSNLDSKVTFYNKNLMIGTYYFSTKEYLANLAGPCYTG